MSPAGPASTDDAGPLIAFYRGHSPDGSSRMIDTILAWDVGPLEWTHDYIQWLFPLSEPSRANPAAPVLDEAQIRQFRSDADLQAAALRSLDVMLRFYVEQDRPQITPADGFGRRRREWMTPGNHNYLRLTRIAKSLRLLGLAPHADALFACLAELYRSHADRIGPVTYAYWADAAGQSPEPPTHLQEDAP